MGGRGSRIVDVTGAAAMVAAGVMAAGVVLVVRSEVLRTRIICARLGICDGGTVARRAVVGGGVDDLGAVGGGVVGLGVGALALRGGVDVGGHVCLVWGEEEWRPLQRTRTLYMRGGQRSNPQYFA